jgi:hypothetical protein
MYLKENDIAFYKNFCLQINKQDLLHLSIYAWDHYDDFNIYDNMIFNLKSIGVENHFNYFNIEPK